LNQTWLLVPMMILQLPLSHCIVADGTLYRPAAFSKTLGRDRNPASG
jgi:hypothetical protein